MKTRLVMASSALFMAVAGIAATFLPQEIAIRLGASDASPLVLGIQVLGALYVGFASVNWFAKDSLIGGIYNRPVAMGNLLHFTVGALALGKAVFAGPATTALISIAAAYALFAVSFALMFFTSPVKTMT